MKIPEGFVSQQHLEHDLDSIGAPLSATSLRRIEVAIPRLVGAYDDHVRIKGGHGFRS
jgi:hypothetical protein